MSNKYIPLNGDQVEKNMALLDMPFKSPAFVDLDGNKNKHLIVINFDGTGNDKNNVDKGELATNVADVHDELEALGNSRIHSKYYQGAGTRDHDAFKMAEIMTSSALLGDGFGTGLLNKIYKVADKSIGFTCKSTAKKAHIDMVMQIKDVLEKNPDAEFHIHVTGFSRGSATALEFLNLVDKHGASNAFGHEEYVFKGEEDKSNYEQNIKGKFTPGKLLTTASILDCVATGQIKESRLTLTIPPTCINITHITAAGEERSAFPLQKITDGSNEKYVYKGIDEDGKIKDFFYDRVQSREIAGARHSDVGGSYGQGDIKKLSKFLMHSDMYSLGIPVSLNRPHAHEVLEMHANDSRWNISSLFRSKAGRINENRYEDNRVVNSVQKEDEILQIFTKSTINGLGEYAGDQCGDGKIELTKDEQRRVHEILKVDDITISFRALNKTSQRNLTGDANIKNMSALGGFEFSVNDEKGNDPHLTIKNGYLMYAGLLIPGLPKFNEVIKELDKQIGDGDPFDHPVNIHVNFSKYGKVLGLANPDQCFAGLAKEIPAHKEMLPDELINTVLDMRSGHIAHETTLVESINSVFEDICKTVSNKYPHVNRIDLNTKIDEHGYQCLRVFAKTSDKTYSSQNDPNGDFIRSLEITGTHALRVMNEHNMGVAPSSNYWNSRTLDRGIGDGQIFKYSENTGFKNLNRYSMGQTDKYDIQGGEPVLSTDKVEKKKVKKYLGERLDNFGNSAFSLLLKGLRNIDPEKESSPMKMNRP